MKFYTKTLGCKVNSCDSEEINLSLILKGWGLALSAEEAEIIIINSCAVTKESVRKVRQSIRKFKKLKPEVIIVLTGCAYAVDDIKSMKEINILLENSRKNKIFEEISLYLTLNKIKSVEKDSPDILNYDIVDIKSRTRAFLKIEDGCNNFCSYCIIPYVRGNVKSKSLQTLKEDVNRLYLKGYKEIILTGINLCAYGNDLGFNLIDAISIVEQKFDRIRLGSLDPYFFIKNKNSFEKIINNKNICPSFHLSLQSGSNKILKKMNRKYNKEEYIEIVNFIKNNSNIATITTDLIVGFPSETQEDFCDSLDLIKKSNFLKVNVFPFSSREGTLANEFKEHIDKCIKIDRTKKAINISENISKEVINNFYGKEFKVLFEKKQEENIYEGYTQNYIKVRNKFNTDVSGKILDIKLEKN